MLKMKRWAYYNRRKTSASPAMLCRCVGVFPNAYIVEKHNGNVMFVSKTSLELSLYSEVERLENK